MMSAGHSPVGAGQPARPVNAHQPQQPVQDAVARVEDQAPQDGHGYTGDDRRQVIDRAPERLTGHVLVEQQGQDKAKDQVERDGDQRKAEGEAERVPELGIAGEELEVIAEGDKDRRIGDVVARQGQHERGDHRPEGKDQETDEPGADEHIAPDGLPLLHAHGPRGGFQPRRVQLHDFRFHRAAPPRRLERSPRLNSGETLPN